MRQEENGVTREKTIGDNENNLRHVKFKERAAYDERRTGLNWDMVVLPIAPRLTARPHTRSAQPITALHFKILPLSSHFRQINSRLRERGTPLATQSPLIISQGWPFIPSPVRFIHTSLFSTSSVRHDACSGGGCATLRRELPLYAFNGRSFSLD